ncbi:hypothetical protein [Micromonospora sp. ALFpr18c]|nr:hypothetical protein [Micromonospora sp. ALFpr18c]
MAKAENKRTDPSTSPPPLDWQSKPPNRDTDAACEQVLRDMNRPRRLGR